MKYFKELNSEELIHINGGCDESIAYQLGVIAAGSILFGLGLLTGISEGFDESVK